MKIQSSIRACARHSLLIGCLLLAKSASADGIYLPPAPGGPGGEDSIETEGGTRCRQSINSNGPYLDLGMVASTARNGGTAQTPYPYGPQSGNSSEALGYARVTVPLGHTPERIDCSRLYDLEIARLKREVELLKMGAE